MKKIREYPPTSPGEDSTVRYQKTTYKLDPEDVAYLEVCFNEGKMKEFDSMCRYLTGGYDGWQGPGGRYWRYYFSLTKKRKYLCVEEEIGLDI